MNGTLFKRSHSGNHFAEFVLSTSKLEPAKISLIVSSDFTNEPVQCITIDQTANLNCLSFAAHTLAHKLGTEIDVKKECRDYTTQYGCLNVGGVFCQPLQKNSITSASYAFHFFAGNSGKKEDDIESNIRRSVISCLECADALQLRSICFGPLDAGPLEGSKVLTYGTDPSRWIFAAHVLFSTIESYYHGNRYTTSLLDIRVLCTNERDAATLKAMFTLEHNKYLKELKCEKSTQRPQSQLQSPSKFEIAVSRTASMSHLAEDGNNDDTESTAEEDPALFYPCDISNLPCSVQEPDTPENVEYVDIYNPDDPMSSPRNDSSTSSPRSESTKYTGKHIARQIRSATLPKLVEHLTHFKASEDRHEFQFAFMLTYRSLTTSAELMQMLMDRYMLPPPTPDISPHEFAKWNREVLKPTRLRIVQILKYWMENQWRNDFEEDEQLVKKVEDFCEVMEKTNGAAYSRQLRRTLERMQQDRSKATQQFKETLPPPIYPKNYAKIKSSGGTLKILDLNPKEIARQLTLLEFDIFRNIRTSEFLDQSWNAKKREQKAPNIFKMINWFNIVAGWVATEIVREEVLKVRVKRLSTMISIANECRLLNNFNAVFEILSGMDLASVHRLKQTWSALDKHSRATYDDLKQLISLDYNFRNIRHQILFVEPPCLPYIGIFLTDLVFIEDGNPNFVHGRINFFKHRKLARLIRSIMTYQNTPYKLTPISEVQQQFQDVQPMSENELYTQSLLREPRQPSA